MFSWQPGKRGKVQNRKCTMKQGIVDKTIPCFFMPIFRKEGLRYGSIPSREKQGLHSYEQSPFTKRELDATGTYHVESEEIDKCN